MNTPNPLIPQGSLPDSRGKSHVRIAVFTILAIHVVLLGALLMAGCKKTSNDQAANNPGNPPVDNSATIPPLPDSNATPVAPAGNPSVTPPPANNSAQNQVTPPPVPPVTPPSQPNTSAPVPPPVDTGVGAATSGEHTIVKGDTFGVLAKKYNTTIKAITEANPGVQSSKLKIGQKIKIPASTGSTAAPSSTAGGGPTAPAAAGGETVHVVKNNDTLWGLARKYGVTQNAIKAANGLKTGSLKVGQKLKIPAKTAATPAPAPEGTPTPAPAPTGTPAQ
jgi:LysM repeat protein